MTWHVTRPVKPSEEPDADASKVKDPDDPGRDLRVRQSFEIVIVERF